MQGENWDDFRIVLCIARADSFAGAARRLAVNESTVARRLQQIETRLGTRLFERKAGKLVPTDAGRDLADYAEAVEAQVHTAQRKVSGLDERAAGIVRITAVPLLANRILAPALDTLLSKHEDLQIDLIADPRDYSLSKREADIALRLARPQTDTTAIAKRVATLEYGLYAHKDMPHETLNFIGYEDSMRDLPQSRWIASEIARSKAPSPCVRVNDGETLLNCLNAGLGKSLLPTVIGDGQPNLIRVPCPAEPLSRDLWLMVHPELRSLIRVKVTIAWIVAAISGRRHRDVDID